MGVFEVKSGAKTTPGGLDALYPGLGDKLKRAAFNVKEPSMDERKKKAQEQQVAFGKNVNPDARPESRVSLTLNPNAPSRNEKADSFLIKDKKDPSILGTFNGKQVSVGEGNALNLGGNPVKETMFIKSEAAKTLVPQPGTASAIPGMQQNPAMTMPGGNVTGLMNQETAMLSSILQGTKSGANFGQNFGQTPAAPGGAPQIGDRAYRDLEKNITDMRNQQKAFTSGNYSPSAFGTLSPGQRMNYAASLGEQIKGMEDTLFNRSSLANDLVKALVAAQSGENTAGTAATAGTEQERIKAGATLGAADMAAGGRVQSAAIAGKADANDAAQARAMKADELRFKHLSDMKKQGPLLPEEETEFGFLTKKLQRVGAATEPGEDDLEDAP